MPQFDPQLIRIMRQVLDQATSTVPPDQATAAAKACLAEFILKAAASGQTSHDVLLAMATDQLQAILALMT